MAKILKHLDLFSGIGGFALAAEMVWPAVEHTFCDNDPFAQAILRKHWPNAKIHDDIKTLAGQPADLITGGFPCQPFSSAGKRKGTEDDRHLWPQMFRVIRESHPRWVIAENVSGLLTWNGGMVLDTVVADLESEGYEVWPFVLPAAGVNAPHRRYRVWIIANAGSSRRQQDAGRAPGDEGAHGGRDAQTNNVAAGNDTGTRRRATADTNGERREGAKLRPHSSGQGGHEAVKRSSWSKNWAETAARICRVDDGLPARLDKSKRLHAIGNAIVPHVAAEIMRAMAQL